MNTEVLARIDAVMQAAVQAGDIAGCSAMVIKDGRQMYYGQSGWANREKQQPMARDTIFRLFSMSKPVTAAAAMLLMERGVIDLLDPVSKYLPGFANQVYATNGGLARASVPVSIKDLLGMTSGIVYGGAVGAAEISMQALWDEVQAGQARGVETSTVDFANRMGAVPLAFDPGTKWQYGASADIMGAVIEVASGKRFGDFLHDEFFEPLGMVDTGFYLPEDKRDRFAQMYDKTADGLVPVVTGHLCILPFYDHEPAFQSGGAGLLSTMDDYAKFACMLAQGGQLNGVRILSPRTVAYMAQNQLTDGVRQSMAWDSLRGHGYGNFMRVVMQEGQAPSMAAAGEYGWDGWLGTYFCVNPTDHMVLMFMVQKVGAGTMDVTRKFRNISYAAL